MNLMRQMESISVTCKCIYDRKMKLVVCITHLTANSLETRRTRSHRKLASSGPVVTYE
jgi:hypothetical protein